MAAADGDWYLFSLYGCEVDVDDDATRGEEEVEAVQVKK